MLAYGVGDRFSGRRLAALELNFADFDALFSVIESQGFLHRVFDAALHLIHDIYEEQAALLSWADDAQPGFALGVFDGPFPVKATAEDFA